MIVILAILGLYWLQFWFVIIKKCILFQCNMHSFTMNDICLNFSYFYPMFTVQIKFGLQIHDQHYFNFNWVYFCAKIWESLFPTYVHSAPDCLSKPQRQDSAETENWVGHWARALFWKVARNSAKIFRPRSKAVYKTQNKNLRHLFVQFIWKSLKILL